MTSIKKHIYLLCIFTFLLLQNVVAKPPLIDSASSIYYDQNAETLYKQGFYQEACEQFRKANAVSHEEKQDRIFITLIIFVLIDAVGLFLFLYLEKQRAFKKLVTKNMQWAKQNECKHCNETELQIINKLIALLEKDKIYRKKELSVNDLAKMLCVNRNVLSKVTNTYFNKTLPALFNEYRIKEAVNLITDSKTGNYKIEVISDMCGFNNRQIFHSAFKKETGLTPNDFRKMAENKDFEQ
ncbi:MAG: helix-turn-helix transcriptional regulator [Bacteroidales bacterium]|jgi:AraC-like DNA-binding protein|nr:helix-turn-helix transcriptional regulator [Bacteroidales bacterium]